LGVFIIGSGAHEEHQLLYRLGQFDKNLALDCIYKASSKYAIKEKASFQQLPPHFLQ
jgi:hypothetical protein